MASAHYGQGHYVHHDVEALLTGIMRARKKPTALGVAVGASDSSKILLSLSLTGDIPHVSLLFIVATEACSSERFQKFLQNLYTQGFF